MKIRYIRAVSLILTILLISAAVVSCTGGNDPTTAVTETDTGATTPSETDTTPVTGKIFDILTDGEISVRQSGNVFDIRVPSEIKVFNLDAYAVPRSDVEWKVSAEMTGNYYYTDRKLPLNAGENTYYLFCTDKLGQVTVYTLIISKAGSCTVTFEGIDEVQVVEQGGFIVAPTSVPTKEGYVFKKWNYDFAIPVTADLTVTAVFEPIYYEISFDPRFGTMSTLKIRVTYGEEVELETPVRTGFVFAGWYLGDEQVKSGAWTITGNVTLEAKWVNRPFKITLDPAGGTIDGKTDPLEIEAKYGEEFTLPVPVRAGFGFGGWFMGDTIVGSGLFEYTEDLTLTAQWNERSATITFVENGGNGGTHTEIVTFDGQLPVPVRDGFTFGGWYSDDKLTTEVTEVPQVDEPVRLFAWWSEEGKPTEFIYELSGLSYKVTDRLDRTSKTLVPAYIGGLKTIDAVEKENPNAGIQIVKKTLTVKIDRSAQIEAVFTPKFSDDDTTLVYESSNPLIASVDENGLVTGVNANLGTCTITVTNPASGMFEFCFIAVLADAKNPDASLTFAEGEVQLTLGESAQLNVLYVPEYEDDDRTILYESSNPLIATVDETGKVTAAFLGECVVTARTADGRFTCECTVKTVNEKINDHPGVTLSVDALTVNTGWVKTVEAVYTPKYEGSDTTVVWQSSDPAVATVVDGEITAHTAGVCTITATGAESEYSASLTLTVREAGVFLEHADSELTVGETGAFTVTVLPDSENGSVEVVYSTSDPSVASVSGGVVTALSAGECVLKAETVDGKYSVEVSLKVTAPQPEFAILNADGVEAQKVGGTWKITVTTDVSFLQLGKIVSVRSGYSWILAKDVEMSEVIVNKAVSLVDGKTVTVYAYCHNADDSFMETYPIEITKELHFTVDLDPAGGILQGSDTLDAVTGRTLTLPEPTMEGSHFEGWYYGDTKVESGVFTWKTDLSLIARWTEEE